MIPALLLILAASLASFALSFAQARINALHGTDHAVHTFLVRRIRENGYRLFVRIPRLLNESYIGALPLYLHWLFARFPARARREAEKLLNPIANAVHVALVGLVALAFSDFGTGQYGTAAVAALLFALTPQFYHALSARNFGLSARSIGLILLSLVFFAAWRVEIDPGEWWAWTALVIACWLTWAFSTFGAQALVIVSGLLLLIGRFAPAAGAVLGLALFVALHPRYSLGYLYHTMRFIRAYAQELAPVYILARRYSLWLDLSRDIWLAFRRGPVAGLRYAYENGLLIALLLNPLLVVVVLAAMLGALPSGDLSRYASEVALCGAMAMVLTSFRATRFLGEPERYVEAVSPWIALAGSAILVDRLGIGVIWVLAAMFLAADLSQVHASRILSRYLSAKPVDLGRAAAAIVAEWGVAVRCAGNNEQYQKLMLANDWRFAYCIAVGHGYCGMTMDEAFAPFPFLRREALERIVRTFRINSVLLDRTLYDTLFDAPPPGLNGQRVLHESEGLRVIALDWQDGDLPSSAA